MNGNKLPKKFQDKAYHQTEDWIWECCCGDSECEYNKKTD